jgi:hypothetical protein
MMDALTNEVGIGSRVLPHVCVRVSGADQLVVNRQVRSRTGLISMARCETLPVGLHSIAGSGR